MQNQPNQLRQPTEVVPEFIDPNQINMGLGMVGWPTIYGGKTKVCDVKNPPQAMGDQGQQDHFDELCYHNAGTCPDCGQGLMQLGDQLVCQNCGG